MARTLNTTYLTDFPNRYKITDSRVTSETVVRSLTHVSFALLFALLLLCLLFSLDCGWTRRGDR